MAAKIPRSHRDLLENGKRAFAHLATVMEDGTPQVTTVWFDTEGGLIRVNTARGRVKARNMSARPYVALAIPDPKDPYRFIQIRGPVITETEQGARGHIDELAGKYTGTPDYRNYRGETRVMYKIRPNSVSVMG